MTNEQKARELGQKYQTPCHGIGDCEFEAYKAAMEMAEWKDKKMIEKALQIYLKELIQFNNLLVRLNPEYDKLIDVDKSYDDFKKKLEE